MNFIWQTFNGDQTDFEYEYITEMLFKNHIKNKFSKMSEDHYNKMYQNIFDWYSEYRKKIIDPKILK